MTQQKKIGIVVQRYGAEVNGGAEVHARMIAEQLALHYEVTVLTSRALDYHTWAPYYPAGKSIENGIKIKRFENAPRASRKVQGYYGRKARGRFLVQKIYKALNQPNWWKKLFHQAEVTEEDALQWLQAQGPAMPQLLEYLQNEQQHYAAFVVFTALYYPGALSVLTVPHKCIFIPTAHDEKAMYIPFYKKVMAAPAWLFFNTRAEQKFSQNLFPIAGVPQRIVGVGIEMIKDKISKDPSVLTSFSIDKKFLVYVGRIDNAKGCDVLMEYFERLLAETAMPLQLVLVGKEVMPIKKTNAIITTGFVTDAIKQQLMLQAEALIIPSLYESLSLVLLESFSCGVPVIANGRTEVLKDHIDESGGGWCFTDYASFKKAVRETMAVNIKTEKGTAGYAYVKQNYSWQKVLDLFDEAISDIETKTSLRN